MSMELHECQTTDEVFEFRGDDGSFYCWNVSAVKRACLAKGLVPERIRFEITSDMYAQVSGRSGVEEDHIVNITADRLEEPLYCVVVEDGSHILFDGNHRLTARYRAGMKTARAFMFTHEQLKPYELVLPQGVSGLKPGLPGRTNEGETNLEW